MNETFTNTMEKWQISVLSAFNDRTWLHTYIPGRHVQVEQNF